MRNTQFPAAGCGNVDPVITIRSRPAAIRSTWATAVARGVRAAGRGRGGNRDEKKGGKRGEELPKGSRVARAPSCRGTAKAGGASGPSGHTYPERPQTPGPAGAATPAPSKAQQPSLPYPTSAPPCPGPTCFRYSPTPALGAAPCPPLFPARPRPAAAPHRRVRHGPVAALRSPLPAARPARLYLIPAARAAPPQGPMGSARSPSAPRSRPAPGAGRAPPAPAPSHRSPRGSSELAPVPGLSPTPGTDRRCGPSRPSRSVFVVPFPRRFSHHPPRHGGDRPRPGPRWRTREGRGDV